MNMWKCIITAAQNKCGLFYENIVVLFPTGKTILRFCYGLAIKASVLLVCLDSGIWVAFANPVTYETICIYGIFVIQELLHVPVFPSVLLDQAKVANLHFLIHAGDPEVVLWCPASIMDEV